MSKPTPIWLYNTVSRVHVCHYHNLVLTVKYIPDYLEPGQQPLANMRYGMRITKSGSSIGGVFVDYVGHLTDAKQRILDHADRFLSTDGVTPVPKGYNQREYYVEGLNPR